MGSIVPSRFLLREGSSGAWALELADTRGPWGRTAGQTSKQSQGAAGMDPSVLGLPGPLCPGKGLHATLRETTSQGGVRWRGLWGDRQPGERALRAPPSAGGTGLRCGGGRSWPDPHPFLHEGVSWTKGRGKAGSEAGGQHLPLLLRNGVQVRGLLSPRILSCQSHASRNGLPWAGGRGRPALGVWHSTSNPFLDARAAEMRGLENNPPANS